MLRDVVLDRRDVAAAVPCGLRVSVARSGAFIVSSWLIFGVRRFDMYGGAQRDVHGGSFHDHVLLVFEQWGLWQLVRMATVSSAWVCPSDDWCALEWRYNCHVLCVGVFCGRYFCITVSGRRLLVHEYLRRTRSVSRGFLLCCGCDGMYGSTEWDVHERSFSCQVLCVFQQFELRLCVRVEGVSGD